MMIKIGFELEAFCLDGATPCLVPHSLPMDECGWLVEIRSGPHHNVVKAVHLLKAEQKIVEAQAKKAGVVLCYSALMEIPRVLKVQAAKQHGKGLLKYQNVYGYETH